MPKTPVARTQYSQIRNLLEKELDEFVKQYKRMPSRSEFQKRIEKVRRGLSDELLSATQARMSALYARAARQTARELRTKLNLTRVDQNAILSLSRKPVLRQSFVGLSRVVSGKLQELFEEAYSDPKGISRYELSKKIARVAEVSDARARTIARTESAKISARARFTQYKKRDDFNDSLFRWVGPSDSRETDTSKRIKRRVGRGVTYDELFRIVSEESAKDFPTFVVEYENIVSHFNSRHTFLRVGTVS